jgi:hypothetical protein
MLFLGLVGFAVAPAMTAALSDRDIISHCALTQHRVR